MRGHPLVSGIFCTLFLGLALSSLWHKTPIYDELGNLQFGRKALRGAVTEADMQRMPVTALSALAPEAAEAVAGPLADEVRLRSSRLPTILAGIVLGLLIFRWSTELYGSRGGLLSLTLFTFSPTVLAHARLVTNDVYAALLMFLSVYLFVAYLRRPRVSQVALCAVTTGLALLSKQTALLLAPVYGILLLAARFMPSPTFEASHEVASSVWRRRAAAHAILLVTVTLLVLNAGYAFRGSFLPVKAYVAGAGSSQTSGTLLTGTVTHVDVGSPILEPLQWLPVPLPKAYVQAFLLGREYNATGSGHGPNYLLGRLSVHGWWYYFLLVMGIKMPLALLGLLVVSALLARRELYERPVDELALAVPCAVLFVFFSFFCTAQIGIRYLLPMFPFLFVAVGRVCVHRLVHSQRAWSCLLVGAVAWHVVSSLSFFPHYLSYCNEIVWDRRQIYRYVADSNVDWGQNATYLERYLEAHRGEAIFVRPERSTRGKVIVDVNALVGVSVPLDRYAWLRNQHEPVEHIAYSWLVYEIR